MAKKRIRLWSRLNLKLVLGVVVTLFVLTGFTNQDVLSESKTESMVFSETEISTSSETLTSGLLPDLIKLEASEETRNKEEVVTTESNSKEQVISPLKSPEIGLMYTGILPQNRVPGTTEKLSDIFRNPIGSGAGLLDEKVLQITEVGTKGQTGAIWSQKPLDLTKDFTFQAYIYLGDQFTAAGDGITFTLQNDERMAATPETVIGDSGFGLGAYSLKNRAPYIHNALSIEFDTYYNSGTADKMDREIAKNDNRGHIAFARPKTNNNEAKGGHYRWKLVDPQHDASGKPKMINRQRDGVSGYLDVLSNDTWRLITISWDSKAQALSYNLKGIQNDDSLDISDTMTFSDYGQSVDTLFGGTSVYWGFTGSTGGSKADNLVAIERLPQKVNLGNTVENITKGSLAEETIEGTFGDMIKLNAVLEHSVFNEPASLLNNSVKINVSDKITPDLTTIKHNGVTVPESQITFENDEVTIAGLNFSLETIDTIEIRGQIISQPQAGGTISSKFRAYNSEGAIQAEGRELVITLPAIAGPTWGTSPWLFDKTTGVLTLGKGELSGYEESPWNRKDDKAIVATDITKINFVDKIIAPTDSSHLFSDRPKTGEERKVLSNLTEIVGLTKFDVSKVTNMSYLFAYLPKVTTLDINTWINTDLVTDMSGMFFGNELLTTIKGFETLDTSKVTTMKSMLHGDKSLKTIDVSQWKTGSVRNMVFLFAGTKVTEYKGITYLDVSSVRETDSMFYNNDKIKTLDLSGWDTASLETMINMFTANSSLEELNLESWDTTGMTASYAMNNAFTSNLKIRKLTLGKNFSFIGKADLNPVPNDATYNGQWQALGKGTEEHPLGGTIKTSADLLTDFDGLTMADTFIWRPKKASDIKITYVDETGASLAEKQPDLVMPGGDVDTPYDTAVADYQPVIKGYQLDQTKLPENKQGLFTHEEVTVTYVYKEAEEQLTWGTSVWSFAGGVLTLGEGTLSNWQESPWNRTDDLGIKASEITEIQLPKGTPTSRDKLKFSANSDYLFSVDPDKTPHGKSALSNLKAITDLNYVDTKAVTSMRGMFEGATSLERVALKDWQTPLLTTTSRMFTDSGITEPVEMASWDMSKVTDMSYMFALTETLSAVALPGAKLLNVESMDHLFTYSSVQTLNEETWDLASLKNANLMFSETTGLTTLNVANWSLPNLITAHSMFKSVAKVSALDVSKWTVSLLENSTSMFQGMTKLTTLDFSAWTGKPTEMTNMFAGLTSLKTLVLNDQFSFNKNTTAGLPAVPKNTMYMGTWQQKGKGTMEHPTGKGIKTSPDLMAMYDGATMADTYVWRPKKASDITIKYVDEKGKTLAPLVLDKILIGGDVDSAYDTDLPIYLPKVKGYHLDKKQLPKNSKGQFSHEVITVTYVYKKDNNDLVTEGPYANDLSFTWAPKAFKLGKRRASAGAQEYKLESESKDRQWVVVNENRSTENWGRQWDLKAQMGELTSDNGDVISGARLSFNLSDVQHYMIGETLTANGEDIVPNDPNEAGAVKPFGVAPVDILVGNTTKPLGAAIILESSNKGQTMEEKILTQSRNRFGEERVHEGYAVKLSEQRLFVPRVSESSWNKDFMTTIKWTLTRDIL